MIIQGAWQHAIDYEQQLAEARKAYLRAQYGGTLPEERERTISCHVYYDGEPVSPGHMDQFTALGWDKTAEQAQALGWVDCGNRWCCPACAADTTPVTIYTIHDEYVGAVVHTNLGSAEEDLINWRDGLDEEEAARITFAIEESTRGYVNSLAEFGG
jgi:hypothetical protein